MKTHATSFLIAAILVPAGVSAEVVISEIQYHPASELVAEEFIELHNTGAGPVNLSGWAFTSGITFTFSPSTTLAAGGRLVVAADSAAFTAKYPAVTNFVAGWTGRLSNSSNRITLRDAAGNKIDEVDYSDDGDWGQRRKDWWSHHGHKGLSWDVGADGGTSAPPYSNSPADIFPKDRSLELINEAFDNSSGQNWGASLAAGGTPGTANSIAAANIAPVIQDVAHFPVVPRSTDPVYVTAQITDDHAAPVTVTANWRLDGGSTFTAVTMADDGLHGDVLAGDGIYGATLPIQPNGTIIVFHVSASDGSLSRTWPAPVLGDDAALTPAQTANCLYQVDDTVYSAAMPLYRIVMKAADKTELAFINSGGTGGAHPYPYYTGESADQTMSHARFNASFVAIDGTGTSLRYRVGVRNRGNGSRSRSPQGLNVMFPNDDPWNGATQFNLNSQYTPWQLFGAALFAKAGVPAPQSRAVQFRWNSLNPAGSGSPAYGFYACNEAWNSDLTDNRFPTDSSGNLYRSVRIFQGTTTGGTSIPNGGDFQHIVPGGSETKSLVDLYKLNYKKQTNSAEDTWTDLIALTTALDKGHSGTNYTDPVTWDADYATAVRDVADVEEWMRWFAVNTMVDNNETNLSNGDGDDFNFYFGVNEPRCKLMPYDLDTILGGGDSAGSTTAGLFRMIPRNSSSSPNAPTPMNAFMKHPEFAPIYYAALKDLLDGACKPANFDTLAQQTLGGVVNQSVIDSMKNFNAARHAYVTSQIPLSISVTTSPAASSGYPRSTTATTTLGGKANAITTRSVKVNGAAATWTPFSATWSASGVALKPGINRVLIQSFDGNAVETERSLFDVWYDDSSVVTVSSAIAADTTWSASGGPYSVTASITVNSGATLTIEPGATVYLGSGVNLTVNNGGRIVANGTETAPIRFSRTPGTSTSWGGIVINGSTSGPSPLTEIRNAHIEFNGSTAIHSQSGGEVELEAITFGNTTVQYLSLDASSFRVYNCVFPSAAAGSNFELVHGSAGIKTGGRAIFVRNFFGVANSVSGDYNDVMDFTGGQRPGPILQIIDNVFIGSGDDLVDLDGTDAWIEGNIFLHVHKNGSPDSASAISGGSDSGNVSHVTITGNLFYDMDHAATAKQGNYYTFTNNTVVRQTISGGNDTEGGVFNLADEGTTYGAGFYAEGNILADCQQLVRNYIPANSVVTFNNNLMTLPWSGPGSGNAAGDPLFQGSPTLANTVFSSWSSAQVMKQWLSLKPGSPARGTGPNGRDKGGVIPLGVSLSANVPPLTNSTSATIVVGTQPSAVPPWSSGYTHYVWRIDGGAWSAATPVTTPVSLSGLAAGPHTVQVVGRNDALFYQNDPAFGPSAVTASFTWTVDPELTPPGATPLVRINEVLARNADTLGFSGSYPDLIELHNAGTATADLSGWGLTDNTSLPYKYTIADGSTLAPGAYMVLYASSAAAVPLPKTGFGLKDQGDTLTLTRSPAAGGGVADVVSFGNQLADYSIGRRTDGAWDLSQPGFGSANMIAAQGAISSLRINEWLASAGALSSTDFIELHNPSTLPVNIGGGFLTDNTVGWTDRHPIRQLTFVGASGYALFKADGDTDQGADHLAFNLSSSQGEIGLFDSGLSLIDSVVYGPQSTDVSQGRTPNGADSIAFFTQPTPGGPNPGSIEASGTVTSNLLATNAAWKYMASASTYHGTYQNIGFDDSAWPVGGQLLHYETGTVTSASGFVKTTQVPRSATNTIFPTYYFRTHFNYTGPLTGVTLRATTMIDDCAVIYLNGQVAAEVRMTAAGATYSTTGGGAPGANTEAMEETIFLPSNLLVPGDNVLAVEVHQNGTGSSDIVWGMKLDADITTTIPAADVVINEVLADNQTLANPDSSFSAWVELYNPDSSAADISDMSLSPSASSPRLWVIPNGTVIPANGHLVIHCDASLPASAVNTGFGLNPTGGALLLFHSTTLGGGLRDSLTWGNQLPDLSVGRVPDGSGAFSLNLPTRGAINTAAATGPLTNIRVNEWLATPTVGADWFELHNSGNQPVLLGGNYVTDSLTNKTKQLITPLTFIGAGGWLQFIADSNSSLPGHVNFALSGSGEQLGVYTASGFALDALAFGAQTSGVSQGRFPDGNASILSLIPTPASQNTIPNPDTDNDGMPDAWETAHGLNPGSPADASLDSDHDGMTNLQEYLAGTDPQDAASRFTNALDIDGGVPTVRFMARAGRGYTVQFSNNLGAWTKLSDVSPQASDVEVSVADPAAVSEPKRFYRILTPPVP